MSGQKIQINAITNANIYVAGNNLAGRAASIKLPDIQPILNERKALGMIGQIQLPSGFQKLEGEVDWNSFYPDVFALVGNPFKSVQLMARSSIERYDSTGRIADTPMVTTMTVMFTKNPLGQYKQQENAEFSSGFSATAVKQVVDGQTILEVDFFANIYRVNGTEPLRDFLDNLGI